MSRRLKGDNPTALFRVHPRPALIPATEYDAEFLQRYQSGSEVHVTFWQPRNAKRDRLYWSTLARILDCTEYPTTKALSNILLIRTGHADTVHLIGGGLHVNPVSVSDMEDPEFAAFFEHAMLIISTELIPGLDIEVLLKQRRIEIGS